MKAGGSNDTCRGRSPGERKFARAIWLGGIGTTSLEIAYSLPGDTLVKAVAVTLERGIETEKLQAPVGWVPLRLPGADAMTNAKPATTMTQVATIMALRFILNRHRAALVLYDVSSAVPVCPAA